MALKSMFDFEFKIYTAVMLFFGIILLCFFAPIVASINEADDSCPATNHSLNKTGISFGIIGILVSCGIIIASAIATGKKY
jgi:hypothetical protein